MTPQLDPQSLLIDFSKPLESFPLISPNAQVEDIGALIHCLTKASPARWLIPADQFQEILAQLNAVITNQPLPIAEWARTLAEVLEQIPDGHLQIADPATRTPYGRHYLRKKVSTQLGENLAKNETWNFTTSDQGAVGVLAISHFPQSMQPQWDGFTQTLSSISKCQDLIVDLRGNGGGDDTRAMELANFLLGFRDDLGWVEQVVCESAESYFLQVNMYNHVIETEKKSGRLITQGLLDKRDQDLEKGKQLLSSREVRKNVVTFPATLNSAQGSPFPGRVFILADEKTGSSGEWAVLYLKQHPRAYFIGASTVGMIHFGNSGILRLPGSGLIVMLCKHINRLVNGSFFEKTGIPPDLELPIGTDAHKFVLEQRKSTVFGLR